jgi:transposase InsO family protein
MIDNNVEIGEAIWVWNVFGGHWNMKMLNLKCYENVRELSVGLQEFMSWYNNKRIHSSLSYKKPVEVYFAKTNEV